MLKTLCHAHILLAQQMFSRCHSDIILNLCKLTAKAILTLTSQFSTLFSGLSCKLVTIRSSYQFESSSCWGKWEKKNSGLVRKVATSISPAWSATASLQTNTNKANQSTNPYKVNKIITGEKKKKRKEIPNQYCFRFHITF